VKTGSAAAYAVALAYSTLVTLDSIVDADFRERRRLRGQRLLFQALRFIMSAHPDTKEWEGLYREYMPVGDDPNHQLYVGRQYHDDVRED
jgi:hypothetical protein